MLFDHSRIPCSLLSTLNIREKVKQHSTKHLSTCVFTPSIYIVTASRTITSAGVIMADDLSEYDNACSIAWQMMTSKTDIFQNTGSAITPCRAKATRSGSIMSINLAISATILKLKLVKKVGRSTPTTAFQLHIFIGGTYHTFGQKLTSGKFPTPAPSLLWMRKNL